MMMTCCPHPAESHTATDQWMEDPLGNYRGWLEVCSECRCQRVPLVPPDQPDFDGKEGA